MPNYLHSISHVAMLGQLDNVLRKVKALFITDVSLQAHYTLLKLDMAHISCCYSLSTQSVEPVENISC